MATLAAERLKEKNSHRLEHHIAAMKDPKTGVVRCKRGDNLDPYFGRIWLAQELKSWAESELKAAWSAAQDDGLIEPDDELRAKGRGTHLVSDSASFSCTAKIDSPRGGFDKEQFILAVAKQYRIPLEELNAMAEGCKKDGTPPLTKRILEA